MASSNSPCAACKLQRRKCTEECIFAPYFPADKPQKFAYIHRVFGASNVAKLLDELNVDQRKDAVESLAYEAECRLRDPVYGCIGLVAILQQKLKALQAELTGAKRELATYIGPVALHMRSTPYPHQVAATGIFGLTIGGVEPSPASLEVTPADVRALPLPPHHQVGGLLAIRDLQPPMPQQFAYHLQAAAAAAAQPEIYLDLYERQIQQQDGIKFTGTTGVNGVNLTGGGDHPNAGEMAAQLATVPQEQEEKQGSDSKGKGIVEGPSC